MPDFERLYHILFNAITDALRKLEAGEPLEAARLRAGAPQAGALETRR